MRMSLTSATLLTVVALATALLIRPAAADAEFGIQSGTYTQSLSSLQAGGHADFTTAFKLNTTTDPTQGTVPDQSLQDVEVELPAGLTGNPQAMPRCTASQLAAGSVPECPTDTQVGFGSIEFEGGFQFPVGVFNMVPDTGEPAAFGFVILGVPVRVSLHVRTSGDYGLTATLHGVPEAVLVFGSTLKFWGVPADSSHDAERFLPGGVEPGASGQPIPSQAPHVPFMINPSACGEPLMATVRTDSWQHPGDWKSATATIGSIVGCDALSFAPSLTVAPDTSRRDSPTGYTVALHLPQSSTPGGVAAADLKSARVTLPTGLAMSPGAATGLVACPAAADGIGTDRQPSCPDSSKLGSVEVTTPLLSDKLLGSLYLLPSNPPNVKILLSVEADGVNVKLAGSVTADPATGQLTATFEQSPQLPFEDLRMRIDGGAQAPLSSPQACGDATTTSELVPWSAPYTLTATPSSVFKVEGCPGVSPFAPGFFAGTTVPIADGFTPLSLTFSRHDGEQDLAGVSVTMPPGVTGMIANVVRCREPEANTGTCSEASRIGTANVAAGAGSQPLWLAGRVYLTGPYKGAPFGLSVVVPAKAGPFDLGNVVVRSTVRVDPKTAAITVTSDPLPQIRDGVPFRLKTIGVTVDRPEFMFNPTNCSQMHVTGTVSGAMPDSSLGATAQVSSPFAVAGCKSLPFTPKFTVLTHAKSTKANGAYLHVKVTSGPGQANIAKVKVELPKQLPSRLTTLQKACPDGTFNASPASCPVASLVGMATAVTPVLKNPLTGPAYLVSHAGAAFPDLVIVLQGEGITLDLVGNTDIKKGITISTFNAVPDAPISTFDLVLPQGPHSVLGAYGNLCKTALNMPTAITGQNGAEIKQTTRIAVSGCPKHKHATRAKRAKTRRKGRSGRR
jgi:hypothetical protein